MGSNLADKIVEVMLAPPSGSVARQVHSIMRPRATGYVALRQQVNSLVLHQALLDKAIRGRDSVFYNCYYTTKGWFYSLFYGERQLSVDELFDVQLENVGLLNFNLCSINSESKRELNCLRQYYDDRHIELKNCVSLIDSTGPDLESKAKSYQEARKEFDSFKKKDAKYFDCELKARKLKREISEGLHKYNIVNESVLDLAEEVKFLEVVEDLLLSSIHLSDHIAIKAKRIERHIASTKQAYCLVRSQQSAVRALDDAVDNLTRFTLGMHNILADGLKDMAGLVSSSSSLNSFYASGIKGLGSLVSSVSEANLVRSQDAESAVQRYLSVVGQ